MPTTSPFDDEKSFFPPSKQVLLGQLLDPLGHCDRRCGDIELTGYLANTSGPVPLVMDLRIDHEDSGVVLTLVLMDTYITLTIEIGHFMKMSLTRLENIALTMITIPLTLSPLSLLLVVRPGDDMVTLCTFYFTTSSENCDRFFTVSGVQLAQSNCVQFHFRRAAFSSQLKSKCGNILAKAAALRIIWNIDGASVESRSHTHPSHLQTSCVLTSSLSLGDVHVSVTRSC
jgi:hypothetical protein